MDCKASLPFAVMSAANGLALVGNATETAIHTEKNVGWFKKSCVLSGVYTKDRIHKSGVKFVGSILLSLTA